MRWMIGAGIGLIVLGAVAAAWSLYASRGSRLCRCGDPYRKHLTPFALMGTGCGNGGCRCLAFRPAKGWGR